MKRPAEDKRGLPASYTSMYCPKCCRLARTLVPTRIGLRCPRCLHAPPPARRS